MIIRSNRIKPCIRTELPDLESVFAGPSVNCLHSPQGAGSGRLLPVCILERQAHGHAQRVPPPPPVAGGPLLLCLLQSLCPRTG